MPIFSFNSLTKLLDLEFTNGRVLLITFVMCCNLPYTRSGEIQLKRCIQYVLIYSSFRMV